MPNKITHAVTGAIVGGLFGGTSKHRNVPGQTTDKTGDTIMGGLTGFIGGVLPDILEPATGLCHRRLMHSLAFGLLILFTIIYLNNKKSEKIHGLPAILSLGLGYLSHLALDARTPKGLPII